MQKNIFPSFNMLDKRKGVFYIILKTVILKNYFKEL